LIEHVDPARLLAVERVAAERRAGVDVEGTGVDDAVGKRRLDVGGEDLDVEAGAGVGTVRQAVEAGKAGHVARVESTFGIALRIERQRRQRIPEEAVLDAANEGLVAGVEGDGHADFRPGQRLNRGDRDARRRRRRLRRRRRRRCNARLDPPDRGQGHGRHHETRKQ
jgi:hypothetical protein